ncbi:RNA 2',3'-cyclic phosphodiesterase OS=Castellaniella defragrans OX=75697 GN=HNR28_002155 PE=3 SV=1 [Castellaniella defragrans]
MPDPTVASSKRAPSRSAASPDAAPSSRRLFFALWPDAEVVDALLLWANQAQSVCGGRRMRADTLHLTLAFLGSVPVDRIPALGDLLAARRWSGGPLSLDQIGRFRGPRVVWAGPSEPIPWLDVLRASLWRGLSYQGFSEPGEPFRPHVSLLRNAGEGDLSALPERPPIAWTTSRLVLAASTRRESGSYYEIVAECEV